MIDKIKAEIKRLEELFEIFKDTRPNEAYAYRQCLKWAEELEKEIKDSLSGETITIMNIRKKIEKAFHGGEE